MIAASASTVQVQPHCKHDKMYTHSTVSKNVMPTTQLSVCDSSS